MNFIWQALWFVVAVSLLVTVHEFGHYWVARRLGFKVLRFSVGFGRPLISRVAGADRTEQEIRAETHAPVLRTVATQGMKFMPKTVQQPHPPIVFGGTSEPALKRTVRLGDGWYGIAHSLDEARTMISRLGEYARAAERTRPIEITLSLRTGKPLTADDVRRMAELGVDRTLAGHPVKALEGSELARFHAEVMDKV